MSLPHIPQSVLRVALALLPLALALLLLAAGAGLGWFDRVVYLRADPGTLTLIAGAGVSTLLGAGLALQTWAAGRYNRRLEAQHAEAEAQLADDRRRFLQRLDHELKNPLTAILAGIANLAEAPEGARSEAIDSIGAQATRLSQLVADLRKLAELEMRPIEKAPVDVAALLDEAVLACRERPEAALRQIDINVPQVPWPLGSVQGDRDLLFLAVYNLLDNALKFTRPGDRIEVRAYEDGSQVAIEVADSGPGIPDEEARHVWEELYRGGAVRALPGSGLGLALVRAIVARHGGQVSVRSRVGHGSVFALRLPGGAG